ncbi:MAG: fliM, partial [Blastococcus sp.]|nr:fliM [Blastococcus sp.]
MSALVTQPEPGAATEAAVPESPAGSPVPPAAGTADAAPAQSGAGGAPQVSSYIPVVAASTTGSGGRSRRGEPRTYDFRRPTKLSREHVRVLQIAQEAFARQATTILTTFLRAGARLELNGIEQFAYDDYVATLPDPVFISTFTLEPLAGKGMFAYPLDIAMAIVDHMLGGSG